MQSKQESKSVINNPNEHSAAAIDASTEPLGFALTLLILVLLITVAAITYSFVISSMSFVLAVTLSWFAALALAIIIYGFIRAFK